MLCRKKMGIKCLNYKLLIYQFLCIENLLTTLLHKIFVRIFYFHAVQWRNSTPCLVSFPKRGNNNVKYFILWSGNRTHNYCVYNFIVLSMRLDGLSLKLRSMPHIDRQRKRESALCRETVFSTLPLNLRYRLYDTYRFQEVYI